MTLPRQFLLNRTYLVTGRTTQRQFWLKPTRQTNQIFMYCVGVAAQKTGIKIHSACVMSNHWHVILKDPNREVSSFYAWVHKFVAKAINCSCGRWENLWSSEKTSVIPLESQEDVLDKIAYTLCNPTNNYILKNLH